MLTKTIFCDCSAGVSGDMFLAALVSLGASLSDIVKELESLSIGSFELATEELGVSGITATRLTVKYDESVHFHRNLESIKKIIFNSAISSESKERSESVFSKLAEAEAKVHGTTVEKIHFHEVGAVDSILDIVGAVVGMELLGVDELLFPRLCLGSGYITCQHGSIPLPAPATVELLSGLEVVMNTGEGEKVTPTGAAILSSLGRQISGPAQISLEKTGYSVGQRLYNSPVGGKGPQQPNILRLMYGDSANKQENSRLLLLESDIDDMSPQWLGRLMEVLFDSGALDVVFIPVQMKKNRPGTRVNVLCHEKDKAKIMETFFRESTTLGIRYSEVMRQCLDREFISVESPWGSVSVKKSYWNKNLVQVHPEYEDLKKISQKTGLPVKEIYRNVMTSLKDAT